MNRRVTLSGSGRIDGGIAMPIRSRYQEFSNMKLGQTVGAQVLVCVKVAFHGDFRRS